MLGPGHVDVVPVRSPDGVTYPGWESDPFQGEIKDGQVWGRGAVDMLNTVAVHAVVFAKMASARVPLKGTLLFCAVSDEEAMGIDGAR
jgi:acetylornithine deacetylase/succinyl-diaminopimelate desuccinylase-like protein